MICTTLAVTGDELPPTPPGATHVFIIDIWKAFPWSKSGAEAVAKITDYLAGISVFGYKLDLSSITGWKALKVEYKDDKSQIYIWFEEIGTIAIPPIMIGVIIILLILGVIVIAWKFQTVAGNIVKSVNAKLRADCIKDYIDKGKTVEEALELCPEAKAEMPLEKIILYGAGILAGAYILGSILKSGD